MTKYMRDIILSAVFSGGSGGYPEPTGELVLEYDKNGTFTENVKDYASVKTTVNVSGGGGASEMKDVNFFDIDGELLYSYTCEEALNLSELPANTKTHSGLTSTGWNFTLDQIKYQAAFDGLDVGATYNSTDDNTHIFVKLTNPNKLTQMLRCTTTPSSARDIFVDWGDGTEPSQIQYGVNVEHTFPACGEYELTVYSSTSTYGFQSVFGKVSSSEDVDLTYSRGCIQKVWFGKNCEGLYGNALNYASSLKMFNIATNITRFLTDSALRYMGNINTIIFPSNVSIGAYLPSYCGLLQHISIAKNIQAFSSNYSAFGSCGFSDVYMPLCVGEKPSQWMQNATPLKRVRFDRDFRKIEYTMGNAYMSLQYVKIPENVSSFGSTFAQFTSNIVVDCRAIKSVPALTNIRPLNINYNGIFVFDDSIVEDVKVATNWSGIADRILSATEYESRYGGI